MSKDIQNHCLKLGLQAEYNKVLEYIGDMSDTLRTRPLPHSSEQEVEMLELISDHVDRILTIIDLFGKVANDTETLV